MSYSTKQFLTILIWLNVKKHVVQKCTKAISFGSWCWTFWPKFLAKYVSIFYPLEYGDCTNRAYIFCEIDNSSTVSKQEDRKLGNNMKLFKNSPLTEFSKQIKSFAWLLWKFDSGLLFSTIENKIIFKKYSTYLSSEFVEIALRTVTSS
jgi:hypothetical protein